jgi:hypothetical protein
MLFLGDIATPNAGLLMQPFFLIKVPLSLALTCLTRHQPWPCNNSLPLHHFVISSRCLVSHRMQNVNYFRMIKCKMPKFSRVCLVPFKMLNFSWGGWEFFLAFWLFFWPLETRIQNGEWIPFCQKFCMVFNSILQNNGPKPKIFLDKWRTKHTLTYLFILVQSYVCVSVTIYAL